MHVANRDVVNGIKCMMAVVSVAGIDAHYFVVDNENSY